MTQISLYLLISVVPLLIVLLYVSFLFERLRKKRGYRYVFVGNILLLVSCLIEAECRMSLSMGGDSLSQVQLFLHDISKSLYYCGWYITGLGAFMLHRNLVKRGRLLLLAAIPLLTLFGFLPNWICSVILGLASMSISAPIMQWLGFSRTSFQWLLILFGVSELYTAVEALFLQKIHIVYSGLVHDLFFIAGLSIVLVMVIVRISDVLDNSYKSSISDGLTGLFNRKYFTSAVQKYVERGAEVIVIFFDLDHFKKVNDTHGHKAGDDALKVASTILKEEIDGKGIAGRYGGEELVVLVTGSETIAGIEEFAERVRKRIEKECITTASIGFAESTRGITAEELIKRADEAMYFSKKNGRNRITGYRVA